MAYFRPLLNPALFSFARQALEKQAIVPPGADQAGGMGGGMPQGMGGGMPPGMPPGMGMDPAMMGGSMPPGPPGMGGGMPMDPAMMGGMGGGMPPGPPPAPPPAPPADPAAAAPAGAAPAKIKPEDLAREVYWLKVMVARLLGKMGIEIPAEAMVGAPPGQPLDMSKALTAAQDTPAAPAGNPAAGMPPIEPIQPAIKQARGTISQKSAALALMAQVWAKGQM